MNKTTHTPGPWTINSGDSLAIQARMPGFSITKDIAIVCNPVTTLKAEKLANARLISAAPDLLEACESITTMLNCVSEKGAEAPRKKGDWECDCYMCETARLLNNAVKKAKG
jgi:hypothetical protein